jgi:hypothetical protein
MIITLIIRNNSRVTFFKKKEITNKQFNIKEKKLKSKDISRVELGTKFSQF